MIRVVLFEGLYVPVIDCDFCGDRVVDMASAAVVYTVMPYHLKMERELFGGWQYEVKHVHKGSCLQVAKRELASEHLPQEEMIDHCLGLMKNAGASTKDILAHAKRLAF